MTTQPTPVVTRDITRPIIGIENRTAQEVFDIMCDRFRGRQEATRQLVEAAEAIRDDLLMRAEMDGDEKIVACGCSVWIKLNRAIDAARKAIEDQAK